MKKIILFSSSIFFISLIIIGFLALTPSPPATDFDAMEKLGGQYDVTINRDRYGVPHIYGKSDPDVAFGLAYAHAEDDWHHIGLTLAMSRGVLSLYQGTAGAQTDYLVHLFKTWDLVNDRYQTDLNEETRSYVEAYANGINYYAAQNGEGEWKGLLPVTGKDIVAGFVFRMPFFFGFESELGKIFTPDGFSNPNKETEAQALLLTRVKAPIGSNGIALAPSRSAEGVTRLVVNSHQPYTGPVAWYEVRLKSETGLNVAGSLFPGAPTISHGHNDKLGWAATVNQPDLTDVYAISVNPNNPNQYRFDDQWIDFEVGVAPIRVKLWGPFSWVFSRELLGTKYGPAIRTDHGTFAITHAGMDEIRQVEQSLAMSKAENLTEWQTAMAMHSWPSINFVYADYQGNIGYVYNGKMPQRNTGYNWKGLLPGDTSKTLWKGIAPFAELPMLFNPASGYVFNANNTPFIASADEDNLNPQDYPENWGIEPTMTNRAYRLQELFAADDSITESEFIDIKFDRSYSQSSEVVEIINIIINLKSINNPKLSELQIILSAWNGSSDVDNTSASLAILTATNVVNERNKRTGKMATVDPERMGEIAMEVADQLNKHYGTAKVRWGDINKIKRGNVTTELGGGPDTVRAVYGGSTLDDKGTLTARAGDTYVMMVEWDSGGVLKSQSIHQFGSATMDKNSPHYADQVEMFSKEIFKPVLFEFDELKPHIQKSYRP